MLKHQQSLCFVDVFLVINNAMYCLKKEIKVMKLSQLKLFTKRLIDIINISIISI